MIDTLRVAEQLKEGGFDDNQARSITYAIAGNNEQLATKQDTKGITQDIKRLTQDIKTNRWLIGLSLSGIIATLILIANLQ